MRGRNEGVRAKRRERLVGRLYWHGVLVQELEYGTKEHGIKGYS